MEESFATLGKDAALEKLFAGTGFSPDAGPEISVKGTAVSHGCLLTEGVDFDLTYFPLKHLGYKAVVCATAGLYARMARPVRMSVRIAVSAKLDFPQIRQLWDGLTAAAREFAYESLRLDLLPSRNGLLISLEALGEAEREAWAPASHTDLLCLSDNLSGAYLGMRVLEREKSRFSARKDAPQPELEAYKLLIEDYLKPRLTPGIPQAWKACGLRPSDGETVDRGIATAVRNLSRKRGLGAKLYVDRLPLCGGAVDLSREFGVDPLDVTLKGGEDHRILFSVPVSQMDTLRHDFQDWTVIGHLMPKEAGVVLVFPDGLEKNL